MAHTDCIRLTLLSAALLVTCACGKNILPPGCRAQTAGSATEWPPERIAEDPVGYLTYADVQIQTQIAERQQRLTDLHRRRSEIEAKSDNLVDKMKDAENVQQRLRTAVQHAEEDNRWPLKFAGRTFDKPQVEAVLKNTAQFIEDRKPLSLAYEEALLRIDTMSNMIRKDLQDLNRMREKIGIDLEKVRLNKGMSELAGLRQRAAEVASFSQTLVDLTADPLAGLAVPAQDARTEVTIDSILGAK